GPERRRLPVGAREDGDVLAGLAVDEAAVEHELVPEEDAERGRSHREEPLLEEQRMAERAEVAGAGLVDAHGHAYRRGRQAGLDHGNRGSAQLLAGNGRPGSV